MELSIVGVTPAWFPLVPRELVPGRVITRATRTNVVPWPC